MTQQRQPRRAISLGATALSFTSEVEAVPVGKGFSASVNGLTVEGQPSFKAAEEVGKTLRVVERGAQFALGDFVVYVENRFGEKAAQIIDFESGWSEKTVGIYRWLASRIAQADRRMDRLSIKHHLLVAALAPVKQRAWLKKAAADDEDKPWTAARLKAALEEGEDLPAVKWWCVVACTDEEDQKRFQDQMEAAGRACTARVTRAKKAREPEEAVAS